MAIEDSVGSNSGKFFRSSEIARINKIYKERNYDHDKRYCDTNPVYLHRTQCVERETIFALDRLGLSSRLTEIKILDFGCGNGRWMSRWLTWGVIPENMSAADIRPDSLACALNHVPQADCRLVNESGLDFPDESFDVVYQNLVFSSILDSGYRQNAAREIARVLKPGGVVLWYDFTFNNPNNLDVKKVPYVEVRNLFYGFQVEFVKKIVLAPPLARWVVPFSWWLADAFGMIPLLRTHLFAVLRKPKSSALSSAGTTIKIRRAAESDIAGMVSAHQVAFPGFPLTLMGRSFLQIMYQGFVVNNGAISLVAECNNKVVGFAVGALQPGVFFRNLLVRKGIAFIFAVIVPLAKQPKLVISRLKMALFYRGERPKMVNEQEACLLSSMAVHPDYAGKGVGTQLLSEYCRVAQQSGVEMIYLTTDDMHNNNVNRFYLNNGFVIESKINRQGGRQMNLYMRQL